MNAPHLVSAVNAVIQQLEPLADREHYRQKYFTTNEAAQVLATKARTMIEQLNEGLLLEVKNQNNAAENLLDQIRETLKIPHHATILSYLQGLVSALPTLQERSKRPSLYELDRNGTEKFVHDFTQKYLDTDPPQSLERFGMRLLDAITRHFAKEDLDRLAEAMRMSPEEAEAQRRSFAYGNLKIDRPDVTREDIDQAAERLKAERAGHGRAGENSPKRCVSYHLHVYECGCVRRDHFHDPATVGVGKKRCWDHGAPYVRDANPGEAEHTSMVSSAFLIQGEDPDQQTPMQHTFSCGHPPSTEDKCPICNTGWSTSRPTPWRPIGDSVPRVDSVTQHDNQVMVHMPQGLTEYRDGEIPACLVFASPELAAHAAGQLRRVMRQWQHLARRIPAVQKQADRGQQRLHKILDELGVRGTSRLSQQPLTVGARIRLLASDCRAGLRKANARLQFGVLNREGPMSVSTGIPSAPPGHYYGQVMSVNRDGMSGQVTITYQLSPIPSLVQYVTQNDPHTAHLPALGEYIARAARKRQREKNALFMERYSTTGTLNSSEYYLRRLRDMGCDVQMNDGNLTIIVPAHANAAAVQETVNRLASAIARDESPRRSAIIDPVMVVPSAEIVRELEGLGCKVNMVHDDITIDMPEDMGFENASKVYSALRRLTESIARGQNAMQFDPKRPNEQTLGYTRSEFGGRNVFRPGPFVAIDYSKLERKIVQHAIQKALADVFNPPPGDYRYVRETTMPEYWEISQDGKKWYMHKHENLPPELAAILGVGRLPDGIIIPEKKE